MAEKIRASATILTYNNAATVARALESVEEFEDVLVLDGGSTDGTQDIVLRHGARLEKQSETPGKITDFTAVRVRSFELAKFDRILYIDSDEWANEELKSDFHLLSQADQLTAYRVSRVPVIEGRVIKYSPLLPDWIIRSVDRRTAEWAKGKRVHEHFKLASGTKILDLRGSLLTPWQTVEEYKKRDKYYLSLAFTKDRMARPGVRRLFTTTLRNFLLALKSLILWTYYAIFFGWSGAVLPWRHEWRFVRYYLLIIRERFKQYAQGTNYVPPAA